MPFRMTTLALPALVACTVLAPAAHAQVPPTQQGARRVDVAAEERAIRAISQQWLAAERRKDANGVLAFYADDAVAVYGGRRHVGTAAIRRNLMEDLARPGYTPGWQTTSVGIAQAGDMAYETGTYDSSWDGGKGRERGHYLTVYRKLGGRWKVVQDITAPEPAGPAKRPAP